MVHCGTGYTIASFFAEICCQKPDSDVCRAARGQEGLNDEIIDPMQTEKQGHTYNYIHKCYINLKLKTTTHNNQANHVQKSTLFSYISVVCLFIYFLFSFYFSFQLF